MTDLTNLTSLYSPFFHYVYETGHDLMYQDNRISLYFSQPNKITSKYQSPYRISRKIPVTISPIGIPHVVCGPLTVIVGVSCRWVDSDVLTPVHLELENVLFS